MNFIIPLAIIIFYLLVYDKFSRIFDASEVAAQSLASINRKFNAIAKQSVPEEVQKNPNVEYDARVQPKPESME